MGSDAERLIAALKADGSTISIGLDFESGPDKASIIWASQPGVVGQFDLAREADLVDAIKKRTGKEVVVCAESSPEYA